MVALLWLPRGRLGLDGFLLALLFGFLLFVGRCQRWRWRALALSKCFSLVVVSSMLFVVVCYSNLLDSGNWFGHNFHLHFIFAGMVAVGFDGCDGVVVGALVQALLDFACSSLN